MGYDRYELPARAIGYLRARPDRAPERGRSLTAQRLAIEAWARDGKVNLAAIFVDQGEAGADSLERRTALADALLTLAGLQRGGLVVQRLDCLHPDSTMQALIEQEVRRLGGKVFSTSPVESTHLANDYDQRLALIRRLRPGMSPDQQAMNNLRLQVGRLRKHRAGGYAYGAPPLGYRAKDGQLVPDPDEQRTLARIRRLAGTGASLRAIAASLTAEGYPTKRGGRWQATQIARLLQASRRSNQQPSENR